MVEEEEEENKANAKGSREWAALLRGENLNTDADDRSIASINSVLKKAWGEEALKGGKRTKRRNRK